MQAIEKAKKVKERGDIQTHDAAIRAVHAMFLEKGIPPDVWMHMTYDQIHAYMEHTNEVAHRAMARSNSRGRS